MSATYEPRYWKRGDTGMGPYHCPICGSVGSGKFMGDHLLDAHVVALAEPQHHELAMHAIEATLLAWADENVLGTRTARNAIDAVRDQAIRMGIDCDVLSDPEDDRRLLITVKGYRDARSH